MPYFPPQSSAVVNGYDFPGATTNGAETMQIGTVPIPADFIGFIEARVIARYMQGVPAAEIPMARTLRTFITKGTESGPINVVTATTKVAAESYEAGVGYQLAATLLPGQDDTSVMEVRVTGLAGGVTYWDAHVEVWGREQGSDG